MVLNAVIYLDLFLKGNAGRFKVLDFDISLVNLRIEVLCPRGTGSVTDLDRLFNSLRLFDWGSRFLRWHFNDGWLLVYLLRFYLYV